jgi:Uma2 family endonuclease
LQDGNNIIVTTKSRGALYLSEQVLQRYLLNESGIYQAQLPNVQGDLVEIAFLPGFQLNVTEIFEE